MRHREAVYSLTLDEVQNHLPEPGKPMNAMNLDQLDELLSTVSAVDQAPSSCSSITNNSAPLVSNYNYSNKATDEVWGRIVQGSVERCAAANIGETTLEEFLFRAGAIHLGSQDHAVIMQQQQQQQHVDWWNNQEERKQQIPMLNSNVSVYVNTMVGDGCGVVGDNHQMGMQGVALPMLKHTLSDSQITRQCDESIEKSFQRKQKRMIKNRESAARSRARKQAYITQLEEEVTKLTDENKRLKKQKEEDMKTRWHHIKKCKYQLRRTTSCHF